MKLPLSNKRIVILIALVIIIIGSFFITQRLDEPQLVNPGTNTLSNPSTQQTNLNLSDDEIKDKFRCNRDTDDVRETDIYCRFPSLYRTGNISDEELKQKLGCNTTNPGPLCTGEKYAQYKAELLAQHSRLTAQ